MSIEEEIAAVKAAAEKKLRTLRERDRRQQQAVDQRLITLLRSEHAALADQLEVVARTQLAEETARRSAKAKAAKLRADGPSDKGDVAGRYSGQSMEYVR